MANKKTPPEKGEAKNMSADEELEMRERKAKEFERDLRIKNLERELRELRELRDPQQQAIADIVMTPRFVLTAVTLLNIALFLGGTIYTEIQVQSIQKRYQEAGAKIDAATEKFQEAEAKLKAVAISSAQTETALKEIERNAVTSVETVQKRWTDSAAELTKLRAAAIQEFDTLKKTSATTEEGIIALRQTTQDKLTQAVTTAEGELKNEVTDLKKAAGEALGTVTQTGAAAVEKMNNTGKTAEADLAKALAEGKGVLGKQMADLTTVSGQALESINSSRKAEEEALAKVVAVSKAKGDADLEGLKKAAEQAVETVGQTRAKAIESIAGHVKQTETAMTDSVKEARETMEKRIAESKTAINLKQAGVDEIGQKVEALSIDVKEKKLRLTAIQQGLDDQLHASEKLNREFTGNIKSIAKMDKVSVPLAYGIADPGLRLVIAAVLLISLAVLLRWLWRLKLWSYPVRFVLWLRRLIFRKAAA
jgi:hypothetical protein